MRVSLLFCRTKTHVFLQNVTRIFESHAKGESRDQKSFGPADKKKARPIF